MREVILPSGATLKANAAPFVDSKNLYQALLAELKGVRLEDDKNMSTLFKDIFCAGFSSSTVEACLWKCLIRCSYNNGHGDLKIDKDTFEPVEARVDYYTVCMEVARENVEPFMRSLLQDYGKFVEAATKIQA